MVKGGKKTRSVSRLVYLFYVIIFWFQLEVLLCNFAKWGSGFGFSLHSSKFIQVSSCLWIITLNSSLSRRCFALEKRDSRKRLEREDPFSISNNTTQTRNKNIRENALLDAGWQNRTYNEREKTWKVGVIIRNSSCDIGIVYS